MNDHPVIRRAPYGREGKYPSGRAPPDPVGIDLGTYYDQPQLKSSHYGLRVALYMFISGLSGAAQMVATAADLAAGKRYRSLVRRGRYLSLLVVGLGPPLLIWDLHTPRRFYNMLRIFRSTSPMSIGTYVLSSFSLFSGVTGVAQFFVDRRGSVGWRWAARTAQLPAALAGAGMATYTAALLSATSTPSWAAAPRALAVQFAGSAIAAAAAALQLCGGGPAEKAASQSLEALAAAAAATEFAGAIVAQQRYREHGLAETTAAGGSWGTLYPWAAVALGAALPLALYAAGRRGGQRRSRLILASAAASLAGSFALRLAVIAAGNASARRPQQSLRFARRGNIR
jgi:protein NrfD